MNQLDLTSKRLEKHMQQLASLVLANNSNHSLELDIVNNLMNSRYEDSSVGLLVDWLELLDPEIIKAQPDVEVFNCIIDH